MDITFALARPAVKASSRLKQHWMVARPSASAFSLAAAAHSSGRLQSTRKRSLLYDIDFKPPALHDFHAATRKNWEQKRREPEGAAKALLMVAARSPKMVLEALHG